MTQVYRYPLPESAGISSRGSVSSNGQLTTSTSNQVVSFTDNAGEAVILNGLIVNNDGAQMTVKLNDEDHGHTIKTGGYLELDGLQVSKITIVESGSILRYSGTFY